MNQLILVPVLIPVLGAILLWCTPLGKKKKSLQLTAAATVLLTDVLTIAVLLQGDISLKLPELLPDMPIYFRVDAISRYFAAFTILMWTCSTLFSFAYIEEEECRYNFFSMLSLGVLIGICFSGNLITTYLFYEMMTLATFPLVMQERTKEAIAAGFQYLFYSIAGAFLGLVGIFFLYHYAQGRTAEGGCLAYQAGGFFDQGMIGGDKTVLLVVVFLMVIGLGSKIGMFPLHGWLTKAHPVAPAPASAVLSGNITKMGMLFLIRVLFYAVGPEMIAGTWVQYALLTFACITVFMGSMLAYKEKILKKRLAYSTVSQTSYSLVGFFTLNPIAVTGALMHVLFHSVIKNLLFLCAGALIHKTGKTKVADFKGIGKTMPVTMWCFTIAGLALVGIPPTSAFLSKWYLAIGAIESNLSVFRYLAPAILLVSALLTAGYLLTITADAFFVAAPEEEGEKKEKPKMDEASPLMLIPLVVLAVLAVVFGMFPTGIREYVEAITALICK